MAPKSLDEIIASAKGGTVAPSSSKKKPKKKGFFQSALGSLADSPVGKAGAGLLDVFDTGRAYVASGVSEGSDFLTDAFNLPGHEYVDASFGEFVDQGRDNVGFGSIFREKAAAQAAAGDNSAFGIKLFHDPEKLKNAPKGSKAFKEFLASEEGKENKTTRGGSILSVAVGLGGDVGLDPLTYVTMGGSKLAGASADSVASAAIAAGRNDIAQKAYTQGKWALNAKELEAIGYAGQGGVKIRAPFTGKVGQRLGLADEAVTATVPLTENWMRLTPVGAYGSVRATIRTNTAENWLVRSFGGKFSSLKDKAFTGTPDEFAKAFQTIQADRFATGKSKVFADEVERTWRDVEHKLLKAGIDGKTAYAALGDPDNLSDASRAILVADPNLLEELRSFASGILPDAANLHGGKDFILNKRTGWQPALRPQATKDWLTKLYGRKGRGGGNPKLALGKAGFEIPAELVGDGEFLGQRLIPNTKANKQLLVETFGEVLDPRQQAQRILEKRMAAVGEKNVMAMFEEDLSVAMPSIIRDMAHRVYRQRMEVELLARGVSADVMQKVADIDSAVAYGAQIVARHRLAGLRLEHTKLEATVRASKDAVARLKQKARVVGNVTASRRVGRSRGVATVAAGAREQIAGEASAALEAYDAAVRLQELLPEIATGTRALVKVLDDLTLEGSEEYVAAMTELAALRKGMDKTSATMGRLLSKRERLLGQLHDAQEAVDQRVEKAAKTAAQREAWETEILSLEGTIADLDAARTALISEFNPTAAADLARLSDQLRQIDDAVTLAEGLAVVRRQAEVDPSKGLQQRVLYEAQLRNNFWADLSVFEPDVLIGKLNRVKPEVARQVNELSEQVRTLETLPELTGIADDIDRAAVALEGAKAKAVSLGRDDVAERYLQLQQKLPIVMGAALNNPANTEGLWHLAVPSKVDLTSPRGFEALASGVENGLGVRLSQSAVTGADGAQVVLKASMPRVYGANLLDLAYQERRFAATGTRAPHGVRLLRNDMLEHAIESGLLTKADFPKYQSQWAQVLKNVRSGSSLKQAVFDAFGPRGGGLKDDGTKKKIIDMLGVSKREWDANAIDDDEWLLSQLADRLIGDVGELPQTLKQSIADSFRVRLSKTNDVIVLPSTTDEWQTIVLRPSAITSETGDVLPNLVTYEGAHRAAQRILNEESDAIREAVNAAGVDLDVAFGGYKALEHKVIESGVRITEIEEALAATRAGVTSQLREKLVFELGLRDEVDRLSVAASGHRAEIERLRAEVMAVAQGAGRAQAADEMRHLELLAQVAEHEAASNLLEAEAVRNAKHLGRQESKLDKRAGKLAAKMSSNQELTGDALAKLVRLETLPPAMRMLSQSTYADHWIANAIEDLSDVVASPDGLKQFFETFDRVTNYWKSQALLRPGFHARNYMGGMFNNHVAGVSVSTQLGFSKRYITWRRAETKLQGSGVEAVTKKYGAADGERFRQIVDAGVMTGGQSTETKILGGAAAGSLRPWSSEFTLFQKNRRTMEQVENNLRGSMAWDRLGKGLSADQALADVARYHFDYDDLSKFERGGLRRVVPFYTWTRKNFPVQVEALLENPRHILRFMHAKRNIELASDEEDIYPSWYDKELTVRLPWAGSGGAAQYWFPDLPFKDLDRASNPADWLTQVNPLIKTPLEIKAGKQYFSDIPFRDGYQPMPGVWDSFGVAETMALFGKAERNADGEWMARDRDIYLVEQWIPVLGALRRNIPSEEKYKARQTYTWASFIFGQTVRPNTEKDIKGELIRRQRALDDTRRDLASLGYA